MKEWGFLRETKELAIKSGIDASTRVCRTGLDEYLSVIFPDVHDWIHNKAIKDINGKTICNNRPDYRSDKLKTIIEFDGLQHYTNPENIIKDYTNKKFYESLGYKVVRIPYFIQLTNKAVKAMFGVECKEALFNSDIPSLSIENKNTPAYLCLQGVERMAKEFTYFPEQFEVNKTALIKENNESLTRVKTLMLLYNNFMNET